MHIHDSILDLQCHRGIASDQPHINIWCFGKSARVRHFLNHPIINPIWCRLNQYPGMQLNWRE